MSHVWNEYVKNMLQSGFIKKADELSGKEEGKEPEQVKDNAPAPTLETITHNPYNDISKEDLKKSIDRHQVYQKEDADEVKEFEKLLKDKDFPDFEREIKLYEIEIAKRVMQMRSDIIQTLEKELKNR